jgi:hypothetical protein
MCVQGDVVVIVSDQSFDPDDARTGIAGLSIRCNALSERVAPYR